MDREIIHVQRATTKQWMNVIETQSKFKIKQLLSLEGNELGQTLLKSVEN